MHAESPRHQHPYLVELPTVERAENRFEEFEFCLSPGATIQDALSAVFDRYDAPGRDRTSFLHISSQLENIIPNSAGDSHRQLTEDELQLVAIVVQKHDRELSAAFLEVEQLVAESTTHENVGALRERMRQEAWGVLGHDLLDTKIAVLTTNIGSIWGRRRQPATLCMYNDETGKYVEIAVDEVEPLPPVSSYEQPGKSRIRAEKWQLVCFLPGPGEYIPNAGTLKSVENGMAIPLGSSRYSKTDS